MVQMGGGLRDRRPNQLSGGQQQRVALARALAIRPKCLYLDEPLSNLDAKLRLEMQPEIRRIVKGAGITAIYVTHDQKEALSMADGIAVLRHGKIEQVGTPAELYRKPVSRFVADFIGETNFLSGVVETVNSTTVMDENGGRSPSSPSPPRIVRPPKAKPSPSRSDPEAVGIAEAPAGVNVNRPSGQGKRVSTTYLGDMAEHLVEGDGIGGGDQGV